MKRVSLELPNEQHDNLQRVAATHNTSIAELVRRALEAQGFGSAGMVRPGRPKKGDK